MVYKYLTTHLFDNTNFFDLEYNFKNNRVIYYQDVNILVECLKADSKLEQYN